MSNRRDEKTLRRERRRSFSIWAAIGAIILIILLVIWLTMADLWGDTDVAALSTTGIVF